MSAPSSKVSRRNDYGRSEPDPSHPGPREEPRTDDRLVVIIALCAAGACLGVVLYAWVRSPNWISAALATALVLLIALGFHLQRRAGELAVDLAEERRRLEQVRQEIRETDRAKAEFLASVSHEIRTPMNAVIGMADLLLQSELTQRQRRQVGVIQTSAEKLLALVNDVVDLARITSSDLRLKQRDFRLAHLLEQCLDLVRPEAENRGLELSLVMDETLAPFYRADPLRLRQILLNLLINAVQFTPAGRVSLEVEPAEGGSGAGGSGEGAARRRLRFAVRDTGVGIDPERVDRLFHPFRPSSTEGSRDGETPAEPRFGSTGIGLAIASRMVDLMGGKIGCESSIGEGSLFWVKLPLTVGDEPAEEDEKALAVPLPPSQAARSAYRVLVVDDTDTNRQLLLDQVRSLGYEGEAVASGHEALTRLLDEPFDAVLMDCQMPGLDGYQATLRLRQQEDPASRHVVIAVTAHTLKGERERCLESRMDDYLAKPYRIQELAEILDGWLLQSADDDGVEEESSPPYPDPSVLELDRLASLHQLGYLSGQDVLTPVLERYHKEGPELMERLRSGLASVDPDEVKRAAHSLVGTSGMLGAVNLVTLARELEVLATGGDLESCAEQLSELEDAFRCFLHALRNLPPELRWEPPAAEATPSR